MFAHKLFYSAGGLVTAVAPVVISGNGVWVGWPGMHMENPNEPIPESDPNDRTPTAGLLSRKVSSSLIFGDRHNSGSIFRAICTALVASYVIHLVLHKDRSCARKDKSR